MENAVVIRTPSKLESNLAWAETFLSAPDARLFQHFLSHIAKTFTLPGSTARVWYEIIPQIGLSRDNTHLFHAVLAVSAAYQFSQHPYDLEPQQQSVQHYGNCLSALRSIEL